MTCLPLSQDEAGQTDATGIEFVDGLYGYAMVLTRNHAQAEDLV
jgi:RNA polymerase sigma-70 factor (ECF subfamily)